MSDKNENEKKKENESDYELKNSIIELRQAFEMFDKDKDGTITLNELATVMRCIGQELSELELKRILTESDLDGNGKIDFEEFFIMMNKRKNEKINKEEILEAFKIFDKDGNGLISPNELRQILLQLGDRPSNDEIEEIIGRVDVDGDGNINYSEFVELIFMK